MHPMGCWCMPTGPSHTAQRCKLAYCTHASDGALVYASGAHSCSTALLARLLYPCIRWGAGVCLWNQVMQHSVASSPTVPMHPKGRWCMPTGPSHTAQRCKLAYCTHASDGALVYASGAHSCSTALLARLLYPCIRWGAGVCLWSQVMQHSVASSPTVPMHPMGCWCMPLEPTHAAQR